MFSRVSQTTSPAISGSGRQERPCRSKRGCGREGVSLLIRASSGYPTTGRSLRDWIANFEIVATKAGKNSGPRTTYHPRKRPSLSGGIFWGGGGWCANCRNLKAKYAPPQFCTCDVRRRFCGSGAWIRGLKRSVSRPWSDKSSKKEEGTLMLGYHMASATSPAIFQGQALRSADLTDF